MLPTESIRPLWATIGTFAGSTLWFIGVVMLFVAGIMLFRAGKHPATKGLRLSGFAIIAYLLLSAFGSAMHQVVAFPAIAQELGFFAHNVIAVVFSLVGGFVDLAIFAMFLMGGVKAARGVRSLLAAPSAQNARPVAQPVGTAAVATSAPAPRPAPVAAPVATPVAAAAARVAPAVAAPVAAPAAEAKPDLSHLIPKGPYARPTSVRTLAEPHRPSLPQLALSPEDDVLEVTQETALASLPFLADEDDDDRREPTLLQFQMARPRQTETV